MQIKDQYNEKQTWDDRFLKGLPELEIPDPFFEDMFKKYISNGCVLGSKSLDLAAGLGRHSLYLSERGWNATAVDISPVAITQLTENAEKKGLQIDTQIRDLQNYSPPESTYDLVVLYYHFDRELIMRISKALKPGGMLICKLAISHQGVSFRTENGLLPLQPLELGTLITGLLPLHYIERPVKQRGVAEYLGIRPSFM
jgi:SAM-dependent methyltransferase